MAQPSGDVPLEARPTPDDAVLDLIRAWAPAQRWFPAKGEHVELERVGVLDLTDPLGEAVVQIHLIGLTSGGLLQVPTTLRVGGTPTGMIGRIGSGTGSGTTPDTLVDGCHDPAFVRAWLAAATHDTEISGDVRTTRVLAGEQSNTSVVVPGVRPPALLKVFRPLAGGANPDVEVPLALSHAGWAGVPRPLAWLSGGWPGFDGEHVVGHLGVLTELVTDARDGFELACEYASRDEDFSDLAEQLGETTAQLHRALRIALPIHEHLPRNHASRIAEVHHVSRTLRDRASFAIDRVPELRQRVAAVEAVYAMLDRFEEVPPLQRVHGDYHLGQVLRSADGHWYVVDFEGEPQATGADRTRPDLALRDLAGMLRSIDYAASVGAARPGWAAAARERLVAGYHTESCADPSDPTTILLLRILELDKALYEVNYEAGNRPHWVHIPLEGVDRLLAG
jgi:maltokinase